MDDTVSEAKKGFASQLGKSGALLGIAGAGFIVFLVVLYNVWPEIQKILKLKDSIEVTEILAKDNKASNIGLDSRITTLEAQRDSVIKKADEAHQIAENTRNQFRDFTIRFTDVEADATSARTLAEKLSEEIDQAQLQLTVLDKEIVSIVGRIGEAEEDIGINTKFTSLQPQRAATRIEQIRFLRRDVDILLKTLQVQTNLALVDHKGEVKELRSKVEDLRNLVEKLRTD